MKYNFIETNDLKTDFLKRHNLNIDKYLNDFDFNINEDTINSFYNKLLKFKDSKFLIVGDYDCDGICSVTIIKRLFKKLNINCNYYIPSRFKEGYGLNKLIVDNVIKHNFDVLFLVDNGVSCKEAIEYAYDNNIKVFIIDHHKYEILPKCEAIIHQDSLSEEFKYCSAGELCFLLSLMIDYDEYNLALAGLTILSDYIMINEFNRFILFEMYEFLNNDSNNPLNLLNDKNYFDDDVLTFSIIPKINSVSRMENNEFNANHVVKFLLSDYPNVNVVANYMNDLNNKRKHETNLLYESIISKKYDKDYIFICSKEISEGYCSSLATRLSSYYDKTVFVLCDKDGILKGSCRSQNLNIHHLLLQFNKYLSFGGHEHAVGLSLLTNDLNDFVDYLNSLDFTNTIETVEDVYVVEPGAINFNLEKDILSLGPFGNGYEKPLIGIKNYNYPTKIFKDKFTKFFINNNLSAITFEQKYLGFNPEYIIGNIKKDNDFGNAYSIIIKGLY